MLMTVALIVTIAAFVLTLISIGPWGVPLWVGVFILCVAVLLMQLPKG